MAITSYSELLTAVENWLARTDLTARIPEFISLAEAKLNRELRFIQSETRSTATVDIASTEPEFITLPGNFQTMRRVRLSSVTGKPGLLFFTNEQINEARYGDSNTTGQPSNFTIFGTEMELWPTPDAAYTIEMVYSTYITALTSSNTSNWLLVLAPDAYLYGTLLEAAPYMRDNDQIGIWSTAFKNTIDSLNKLSQDQRFGAPPMAMMVSGVTP